MVKTKMDNPEELATQSTQDEEKQYKNTTQHVLNTTISKQDIHPCIGSILIVFIIKYNVFNKYIIYAITTAINTCKTYLTLVKGR